MSLRRPLVAHNAAVAQRDAPRCPAGQRRVVRHQHQRGSFALVERDQQFQHMLAVLGVEIAGGLVGQQNGRPHHEGARQGHALLLAARKLDGVMIAAIQQADAFEQFAGALGTVDAVAAGQFIRQQNIFFGRQGGQQMVGLKNEADFAAAQQRHAVFIQAGDVLAIQNDPARSGRIEAGQKAQQRALAAARRSHDGDEFAALQFPDRCRAGCPRDAWRWGCFW